MDGKLKKYGNAKQKPLNRKGWFGVRVGINLP